VGQPTGGQDIGQATVSDRVGSSGSWRSDSGGRSGSSSWTTSSPVALSLISRGTAWAGRTVGPRAPPSSQRLARGRRRRPAPHRALAPDRHPIIEVLARLVVLELQGCPRGLGRRLADSLAWLAVGTTRCRGPLAAELLLQGPWVGDSLGVPRVSWTGPEEAREGRRCASSLPRVTPSS
jgi:hypothetical protein